MASGDPVGFITGIMPPATNPATPTIMVGTTSASAESVPLWLFGGGSSDSFLDFYGVLIGYDGGGLTVSPKWAGLASSGDVVWRAAIRRIADDAEDVDTTAHTYSYQSSGAVAAPSAIGEFSYDSITLTDGSQMDSLANNEFFIMRLQRNASDTGNDTMAAAAQLANATITET